MIDSSHVASAAPAWDRRYRGDGPVTRAAVVLNGWLAVHQRPNHE
jgi:hypothetical protein